MTDEPKPVSKWMTLPKRRKKEETELERIARTGDPLAEFYREMTGKSARIHIPLRDPIDLRRIATILRVLAGALETLSRSKERTFTVLFEARQKIKLADAQIRSQRALGTYTEKQ
ncbi:hypothetical protein [Pseudoroseomonas ludipueritiae]|uniref:Uncharacterized protein n=1 Tax=Pseudoroseomonas ludipueritiae TaxID=198093 RepID=A0ABR7R4K6_9PROT|nr:hypothetical protein [Pseudoroseomonas ludipueritiae]MBC9176648.1 hypothetical protein [Pseudoroseomonas ludipueritiae]